MISTADPGSKGISGLSPGVKCDAKVLVIWLGREVETAKLE